MTNKRIQVGGGGHLLASSFVTASKRGKRGAGRNKLLLGMPGVPAQCVLDKTQIRSITKQWYLHRWDSCVVSARMLFLVIAPHKASHNNPGTVSCRIVNLGQKLSEMWSPIAPLHGFAIKTEAIISSRSA